MYMDSRYKDKTVLGPSYLYNENPYNWKDDSDIKTGTWMISNIPMVNESDTEF